MIAFVSTTPAADKDIFEIASYLAVDSADTAPRFEDDFWQTLERLRSKPEIGSSVFGIAGSLRYTRVSRRFRRYLIFYRLLEGGKYLQVVRVLRGARNRGRYCLKCKDAVQTELWATFWGPADAA